MESPKDARGHHSTAKRRSGPLQWLLRPLSRRISVKILAPYLAVILVLAVMVTYSSIQQLGTSLRDRLVTQLLDGGRKANDTMVTIEENYLAAYRAIAFTQGVDTAVASKDTATLEAAIQPIQINFRVDYIEVLDAQGVPILSSFAPATGTIRQLEPDPTTGNLEIVKKILNREQDALGDKWAAIVPTSRGYLFYAGGPIRTQDDTLVGVLLVGMPLQDLITDLTRQASVAVSLYDEEGKLLATPLPYRSLQEGVPVELDQASQLLQRVDVVFGRRLHIGERDYEELLGRLEVRKAPLFVMGVALPSDSILERGSEARNQQLVLFGVVIAVVLVLGLTLAERITRPLRALVDASRSVAAGDLTASVPPTTEDETGELTMTFNEMVSGLRERERVRETFGKYMTREVTDYLLTHEVKLGGELREVTVMLSDIRSFTSLSESMAPEEVVTMLNNYFAGQVGAVLRYRGRVDKFMGDAILAVFGAPIPLGDHALRAVLACLQMRAALAEFNRLWTADGGHPIRIGIGVNTGPVVVGNIGSTERMEYTIIGDAVNITQRIEDLTKEFATDILITETTYAACKDIIDVGEPHMVTVRGRTTEMAIYPVTGLKPGVVLPPELALPSMNGASAVPSGGVAAPATPPAHIEAAPVAGPAAEMEKASVSQAS